jgi:hypothetical protein
MRTVARCALACAALLPLACGGGGAGSDGAKAPGGPAGSQGASGDPGAAPPNEAATTTVALADGGDLQGAKLTETKTVAAAPAASSSGTAPKGPRAHEAGRGPEDIRAIIMARRDEARACYDAGIKDHPGIEGDLVIAWTIDPKGNVTQAAIDSSRSQIVEPSVVACVTDIIKKVQFASSPGGFETRAFYPFNFHPHHGGATHTP